METTLQSNQSITIHVILVSQSSILLAKNRNNLISIINPQSISYQNLNISIQFTIHSSKQQSIKIILQTNQAKTIHIHHNSSHQILFLCKNHYRFFQFITNHITCTTKIFQSQHRAILIYSSLHHNIIIS